jgi:DnaJ-class molecular chaperone
MADEPYDPGRCSPCRGTGVVVSNLGGSRSEIECPWCGGTGRRQPRRNAQEAAPAAAAGDEETSSG